MITDNPAARKRERERAEERKSIGRRMEDRQTERQEREGEEEKTLGSVVITRHSVSHTTHMARHYSFIQLNLQEMLAHLAEQIICNLRFYCTYTRVCMCVCILPVS